MYVIKLHVFDVILIVREMPDNKGEYETHQLLQNSSWSAEKDGGERELGNNQVLIHYQRTIALLRGGRSRM